MSSVPAYIQSPNAFCWTKMGAESGEALQAILKRKEWERALGGGVFYWGVGNSVAPALDALLSRQPNAEVLFSPIRSRPKGIDERPAGVQLWLTYYGDDAVELPLPTHVFVTSRLPTERNARLAPHFALVCRSDAPLTQAVQGAVDFNQLRNFLSGKPLGFSQVTSVVQSVATAAVSTRPLTYPVAIRAQLQWPHVVRFATGIRLAPEHLEELAELQALGTMEKWRDWVRRTKMRAWSDLAKTAPDLPTQMFLKLGGR